MYQRTGNQMKLSFITTLAALAAIALYAQQAMPRMTGVEPDSAKAGAVLTVRGEHLDKGAVVVLYLTDGKKDTKVQMTVQIPTAIKFKEQDKAGDGHIAVVVV